MTQLWLLLGTLGALISTAAVMIASFAGTRLILPNNELVLEAYRGPHFNVIYRVDIAHRITQWVRTKDHFVFDPNWSPDGQQIAFVTVAETAQTAIYIMDAEGGGLHRLNDSSLSEFAPIWSPDGRQIAFIRRYSSAPELMVTDLQTYETRRLTNGDGNKHNATWSPDSQTLTFANESSGVTNLYNLNLKSGETQLAFSSSNDVDYPAWSPDGRYLLYIVTGGRAVGIYLWDTQEMQSILINPIFFTPTATPSWTPDGRYIVYTAQMNTSALSVTIFEMDIARCLKSEDACTPRQIGLMPALYQSPRWRPSPP